MTVVVGADRCHDGTAAAAAEVVTHAADLDVIEGRWGSASGARRAIIAHGLGALATDEPGTWIANTDADCLVPSTWICRQVAQADHDVDLVLGTVVLSPTTSRRLTERFADAYANPSRPHVHAANLGVRASAYRHVGGWNDRVILGEEHDLLRRLVGATRPVVWLDEHHVVTSGRTVSRVDGGFASFLADLDPPHGDRVTPDPAGV